MKTMNLNTNSPSKIFFRPLIQLLCCIALLGSISCSSEELLIEDVEKDTPELAAKATNKPPYNNGYKYVLQKSKLQHPKSNKVAERSSFNNFVKSDYFFIAGDDPKWMTLRNSKGSGKRTELRRLGEFSKTSGRSMSGELKITKKPKGGFTILQLHRKGAKVPALRIKYEKGKFSAVHRVKDSKSAKTKKVSLGGGTSAKFKLKVSGGKVYVELNGKKTNFDLKSWPSNGFYYKAGAYNQSSGTSEVRFKSLNW